MIRLDIDHTKFLELIDREAGGVSWAELPKEGQETRYQKMYRRWVYFLEWNSEEILFRANLVQEDGKAKLTLERVEAGQATYREVWMLDMDQLLEEGMAIDTDTSLTKLTRAEQEQLKARFARIAAKLKGSGSR